MAIPADDSDDEFQDAMSEPDGDWDVVEKLDLLPALVPTGQSLLAEVHSRQKSEEDLPEADECREKMQSESPPLFAFTRLLDQQQQRAIWALFAACHSLDTCETIAELDAARKRIAAAFDGESREDDPEFASLRAAVAKFPVPRRPFEDMAEGVAARTGALRFATKDALLVHCYRHAGVVGLLALPVLCGDASLDPEVLEAALSLGVALLLTDLINCVGHHYRTKGENCCIPEASAQQHGLGGAELIANLAGESQSLVGDPRWQACLAELLEPVRPLLQRAAAGGEKLPGGGRVAVRAAVRMCRRVVAQIEARGYDSLTRRAKMFSWRMAGDVAGALWDAGDPE